MSIIIIAKLQGCGASKVNDLALWLRNNEDYFTAGKLWKMLMYGDQSATQASKNLYLRHAWQALAKVPTGTQLGALSLEVDIRYRVYAMGGNEEEKAECLDWLVDLNGDKTRMDELTARGKSQIYVAVSLALISFTRSHYATKSAAPLEQLQRGARLSLQYSLTGYSDWAEHTGFLKWYRMSMGNL
jgi:hypothetical protein